MYNYAFKENDEYVLNEAADVNIKFDKRNMLVNILLTNKNVLVFYDTERDSALKTGGMQVMPEFEILFKVGLDNMDYIIKDEDTIFSIYNLHIFLLLPRYFAINLGNFSDSTLTFSFEIKFSILLDNTLLVFFYTKFDTIFSILSFLDLIMLQCTILI